MSDQRAVSHLTDAQNQRSGGFDERTSAQLRAPLLVGCIAYAILTWMILLVIVIYAWKLFGS